MTIPATFKLMGRTWTVEQDSLQCEHQRNMGLCQNNRNKILLLSKLEGEDMPKDEVEQTFFHELTHAVLFTMGKDKLNEDEKFVDVFAGLLHQALAPHMQ